MPRSIFNAAISQAVRRGHGRAPVARALAAWACMAVLAGFAAIASAATTATLERNRIALGESVMLEVRSDGPSAPDFAPLRADFALSDTTTRRQMQVANGRVSSSAVYEVQLTPRRAGTLQVPALQVGRDRTAPLALSVEGAAAVAATPAPATAGQGGPSGREDVYVQTVVDDPAPYVQQSVGVTLRFYYAVPLASGQLDLDAPAGASLQRVGEDVPGRREIGGRLYNVIERRFLLIPDRSGRLVLPAARFAGQGAGGVFGDFFGNARGELHAASVARALEVRPVPAAAPQPWLPLRDLRLRYVATPQAVQAGQAATFSIEAVATGATRAQMPELPVPAVAGAQVFPEPAQYDERFVDGSPVVTVTRRYSVVPAGPGRLTVPGIGIDWWSVHDAAARSARLPDLSLQVGAGAAVSSVAPAAAVPGLAAAAPAGDAPAASAHAAWPWIALAGAFAVLWLLTLAWAVRGRRARGAVAAVPGPAAAPQATHTLADLRRALDSAGLAEVGEVLRRMHAPPLPDMDAVCAELADPDQRAAVEHLGRAQWRDGDVAQARQALRAAFRQGPRWKTAAPPRPEGELPPLYPRR